MAACCAADGGGCSLTVSVVVVLAVPKLHAKLVPAVRSALSGLWDVARDRHKRLELFGGNVASELLYALALGRPVSLMASI